MAAEDLLSDENKKRCIEEFLKQKPLRVPKVVKRKAAILIPLVNIDNSVGLVYTKRAANLSSHAREVCFPGLF